MLIGCDIDDVLFPWVEVVSVIAEDKYGVDISNDWNSWSGARETLGLDKFNWFFTDDGVHCTLGQVWKVHADAKAVLRKLLTAGHEVHFVTHRNPSNSSSHTAKFLETHFGDKAWAGLHILSAATDKHALMNWDVFIDDKVATVESLLLNTRAHVFMPVRPWNEAEGAALKRRFRRRLTHYTHPKEIASWVADRA